MNSGLKSGLVLLVLGVFCGALLALVNYFTEPIILDAEEKAKYSALETFYDLNDYDLSVIEIEGENVQTIFVLEQDDSVEALIYLVSGTGYNGPVQMLIAINADYTVEGYTVVSHSEDAGFGADIIYNDFNVNSLTDISGFAAVAGASFTSSAIRECFTTVSQRAANDFGGGLDD